MAYLTVSIVYYIVFHWIRNMFLNDNEGTMLQCPAVADTKHSNDQYYRWPLYPQPLYFCLSTCHRLTLWFGSLVVRVLAWQGMPEVLHLSPSRAMCFFLSCDIWWLSVWVNSRLRAAKGLSRQLRHGSEQIWGRITLSRGKLSQADCVAR